METFLLKSSLREFTRARRVLPWILVGLGALGLALAWPHLSPGIESRQQYADVSGLIVYRILALAAAIFTTAVVSQEVEQKTIVYLLTRPVARWKLLLFRYAAAVAVVAGLAVLAALWTSIGVFQESAIGNPLFRNDVVALVLGAFAYCALFLFISLLFNRAMIICLLYAFGWETAAPNMPGDLYHLSIFSHLQAIAEHPAPEGQQILGFATGHLGTNLISRSSAFTTLVLVTLIALVLSAWWFTRFEYVPREDAE